MIRAPHSDDAAFDRAWAAFVRHDRADGAPAALEVRVRRSVTARAYAGATSSRWRPGGAAVRIAAGLAACLVAVVVGRWLTATVPVHSPSVARFAAPPVVALPRAAAPVPLVAGLELPVPRPAGNARRATAPRADRPAAAPPAITAVPANGPLQVIRVRIDASALDALGVAVTGSVGTGLVDVDLVVGADGWPMDVRRIRPVFVDGPSQ
jgi:hypothetical protein